MTKSQTATPTSVVAHVSTVKTDGSWEEEQQQGGQDAATNE